MKNKLFKNTIFSNSVMPRALRYAAMLVMVMVGVQGVWALGTTTKSIPAGTQIYGAYKEVKTNARSNNWINTAGSPGNSSSSYTELSGWLDGDSSSSDGYGNMTVQSGKTISFYVTNITSVSILGAANNSSRTIKLSVKCNVTEVGTVATATGTTIQEISYASTLDKTKNYVVTVSASDDNNAKFYQIKFVGATASSNFTNGQTVFIRTNGDGAWGSSSCVKAWWHVDGVVTGTNWMYNGDGFKMFYATVPETGDYSQLQLQRFSSDCNTFWNSNGDATYTAGKNTVLSNGTGTTDVSWCSTNYELQLFGSSNSWGSSLGTLVDKNNGEFTYTISDYVAAGTSLDFKVKDNNAHWFGSNNTTLSGMVVGSTYDITATFTLSTGALAVTKTLKKCKVTFDANGHGTAPTALTNITPNAKISAPTAPSATGYTFGGWYKEAGCTNEWTFASDVVEESMTLYAKWTATPYTITYNGLNGASNSNPATYTIESALITFAAPGARTGYTFSAWDPTSIAAGSTGNKTTTASWTAKTYTITLDANTANHGTGTNKSATATYDSKTLTGYSACSGAAGYTLTGYFTAATSGTKVMDKTGALVANVDGYTDASGNWTHDAAVTLYAQYEEGSAETVIFDYVAANAKNATAPANGASLATSTYGTLTVGQSITAQYKTSSTNTIDAASAGYFKLGNNDVAIEITLSGTTFAVGDVITITGKNGGSGDRNFEIGRASVTDAGTSGNISTSTRSNTDEGTFTATITEAWLNGDAPASLRIFRKAGNTMYLKAITITRSGSAPAAYTWQVFGNFVDNTSTAANWKAYDMTNGVATITNVPKNSHLLFKLRKTNDGGTNYLYYGAQNESNEYATSNADWTLTSTNEGYNIKLTTGAKGSYVITASAMNTDAPHVTVTYPAAYTVSYDRNGATSGSMTSHTLIASGESQVITTWNNQFTKSGYHFSGWNTAADGSGTAYADGATIENITSDITLYAQWAKEVQSIAISAEGGVNTIQVGGTLQLSVAYSPEDATYGNSVTWTSSNTNYLTVNSTTGLVTGVAAGSGYYITATSGNGKTATYNITIEASSCDKWQVWMWNTGGTHTRACLHQIGETTEWQSDQVVLPSNSDAEKLKVLFNGAAQTYSAEWTTRHTPLSDKAGDQYYAGQDAVGYFRIYTDNTAANGNYALSFEPIYRVTYGIENQEGWVAHDFTATGSDHQYNTDVVRVPEGYFTNASMKYYVGTKKSNGTTNFVAKADAVATDKSNTVSMSSMPGLTENKGGKYGYFKMWSNSTERNWYCTFVNEGYAYELRDDEGNLIYYATSATASETTIYNGGGSAALPTKDDCTLSGWARSVGGEKVLDLGAAYTYCCSPDVLYPFWTKNPHTLTVNDEAVDCSKVQGGITAGQHVTLTNTCSVEGKHLTGYDASPAVENYSFNAETKTLTFDMPASNVTLTAVWASDHDVPVVTWTVPTVYAGGKYAVSVQTTSDATLVAGCLTATGGELSNIVVNAGTKTISAVLAVPADAAAAPVLRLQTAATANYTASNVTKNDITLGACGGDDETIFSYAFTAAPSSADSDPIAATIGTVAWNGLSTTLGTTINEHPYVKLGGDFSSTTKNGVTTQKNYIKCQPTSALQVGDIIYVKYVSTNSNHDQPSKIYKVDGTLVTALTNPSTKSEEKTDAYTIAAETALVGETAFYIARGGSNNYVNSIWVTRDGSSAKQTPTIAWSTNLSAGVEKTVGDAVFTYTASSSNSIGAISYSSSNTDVATVNASTGEVTVKAAGSTTITATVAAVGCFKSGTVAYTLTVHGAGHTLTVVDDSNCGGFSRQEETGAEVVVNLSGCTKTGHKLTGFEPEIEGGVFNAAAMTYTFTMPDKDVSLMAVWTPVYSVSKGTMTNGNVTIDKMSNIAAGETVTLTPVPASNYVLDEWNVHNAADPSIRITVTANMFIMPAYDVQVDAIFEEAACANPMIIRATMTGSNTKGKSGDSGRDADSEGRLGGKAYQNTQTGSPIDGGYKMGTNGNYVGIQLTGGNTFQENDIVVVYNSYGGANGNYKKMRLTTGTGDENPIYGENWVVGENEHILTEAEATAINNAGKAIYVSRTASTYEQNPYIKYIAVYRLCSGTYWLNYDMNGIGQHISRAFGVRRIPYELPTPETPGYVFQGWYNDKECTEMAMPGTEISKNTTVYAKWQAEDMDCEGIYDYSTKKDAAGTRLNPQGGDGAVDAQGKPKDNAALTTPWTIFTGDEESDIASVVLTNGLYDNKNGVTQKWVTSYIKMKQYTDGGSGVSSLKITMKDGKSAVLKIKIGGYETNTTVMMTNTLGTKSRSSSGYATTEDGFEELQFALKPGENTMKVMGGNAYISYMEICENTISICDAPVITSQPVNLSKPLNETPAHLTVEATGEEICQWYTCASNGANMVPVADATSKTLTIAVGDQRVGTTFYKCLLTSDCGSKIETAVRYINITPQDVTLTYTSYTSAVALEGDQISVSAVFTPEAETHFTGATQMTMHNCTLYDPKGDGDLRSPAISLPTTEDQNQYVDFTFTMKENDRFKLENVNFQIQPVSTPLDAMRMTLSDAHGHSVTGQLDDVNKGEFSAIEFKAGDLASTYFIGTITAKIWGWSAQVEGKNNSFRFHETLTVKGELSTLPAPEIHWTTVPVDGKRGEQMTIAAATNTVCTPALTITYHSDNTSVITVDENTGVLNYVGDGDATVWAHVTGDGITCHSGGADISTAARIKSTVVPCDVKYYTGLEGDAGTTVTVGCGAKVEITNPTACDGTRTFMGWTTNGSFVAGATQPEYFNIATTNVMNNMTLYAVWRTGKDVFTKQTGTTISDYSGKYIIIEKAESKYALSATQMPVDMHTVAGSMPTTIESSDSYLFWTVAKSGDKYTIHGQEGYLAIDGSDKVVVQAESATLSITKASDAAIYKIGNASKNIVYSTSSKSFVTHSSHTTGYLYKQTSTNYTYSLNGACPHVYHATEITPIVSAQGLGAKSVTGTVIVENPVDHEVMPVGVVTGANASMFAVTVTVATPAQNADGSYNYNYVVTYTPTAYNATHAATIVFQDANPIGANVVASDAITVTGKSLPEKFVIAVLKDGKYLALPENTTAEAAPISAKMADVTAGVAYGTGEEMHYTLTAITNGTIYEMSSGDNHPFYGNATGLRSAASAKTESYNWQITTNEDGTYRIKNLDQAKFITYNSTNEKFNLLDNSASNYYSNLYLLPVVAETGIELDIVDWTASSVTLNMNGYSSNLGAWSVETNSVSKNKDGRNADRTLTMATASPAADSYIEIKTYGGATPTLDGDRYYKVPHIITSNTTLAGTKAGSNIYVKSGVLTVASSTTVAEIVVNEGAELRINSGVTLTCEKLVLRTEPWSAAILTNKGTLTCTKVFYTRRGQKGGKFQQFALPYESQIADVKLSNGVVPAYGSTYTLRWYDCESRAANGVATGESSAHQNWKTLALTDGRATIAAHTGYTMVVSNSYYREFYFPVTMTSNTEVAVTTHASSNPKDANWNFICSPLASKATLNQAGDPADYMKICEMVDDDGIYWQHVPSTIYPAVPFYYQAPVAKTLNFSAVVPASVAARSAANTVRTQWLQVVYENEAGVADETNIYLNSERFTADYDMGYDEAKMKSTSTRPQIYTQLACGDLAFAAVPDSLMLTPIALAVYSPAAGEYTFSLAENEWLDRLESVMLTDTETGAMINLIESTYTAAVPAGTTTGRFFLNATFKAPGIATEVDNAQCTMHNGERAVKFLWHDHIYIRKGAHVYDVNGKEVQLFNK